MPRAIIISKLCQTMHDNNFSRIFRSVLDFRSFYFASVSPKETYTLLSPILSFSTPAIYHLDYTTVCLVDRCRIERLKVDNSGLFRVMPHSLADGR